MKAIGKLENTVASWLKPAPHLSQNSQKWIAQNAWWIALVGVILSMIILIIMLINLANSLSFMGWVTIYGSYYVAPAYTGWWVFSAIVSLLFLVVTIALTVAAIAPLQKMQKRGWNLLFLILILNAISSVVSAVISLNPISFIFGILFGAIFVAIGAYFLYEIREYFGVPKKASSKPLAK